MPSTKTQCNKELQNRNCFLLFQYCVHFVGDHGFPQLPILIRLNAKIKIKKWLRAAFATVGIQSFNYHRLSTIQNEGAQSSLLLTIPGDARRDGFMPFPKTFGRNEHGQIMSSPISRSAPITLTSFSSNTSNNKNIRVFTEPINLHMAIKTTK